MVPLLALWLDDAFFWLSGETTRRAKALAADARCVMTTSSQTLPALDLVVEGECRKVTDDATLRRVDEAYQSVMQWPLEAHDGALYGPSALAPRTALGFPGIAGAEAREGQAGPFAPTCWRFQQTPVARKAGEERVDAARIRTYDLF